VNTDIQEINATRKTICVSLSAEEIAELENKLIAYFKRQARVPGFRPGKAPEKMVRARFDKDIRQELKQRVISKAHQEGVAGADFEVFNIVDLEEGEIASGAGATLTFTVDVMPEFELPAYAGLSVTSQPTEASEAEIDKMLTQILNQRAEYQVVEQAAAKGDYVRCSYEGKIGDELVADLVPDAPMYGSQNVTWEEAGSEDAPGVRAVIDGLVGMSAGDEKDVSMEFPADFKPEALAGKTASYHITAEEVRQKVLPELNDELLKSLGAEDEADLRQKISQNIEEQKQQQNAKAERQQITEALLKAVDFPIPESGVASETDTVLREFMQRNLQQGIPAEEFEKHKQQLYDGASKAAHDRLKSRLILSRIAEQEKVKAEQEDFSRMIMMQAQQTGQAPEKLVKELQQDQTRINRMRSDIILGKTMDLLVEKAERVVVPAADSTAAAGE